MMNSKKQTLPRGVKAKALSIEYFKADGTPVEITICNTRIAQGLSGKNRPRQIKRVHYSKR